MTNVVQFPAKRLKNWQDWERYFKSQCLLSENQTDKLIELSFSKYSELFDTNIPLDSMENMEKFLIQVQQLKLELFICHTNLYAMIINDPNAFSNVWELNE